MTTDAQSAREDLAFLRGLVSEDPRPGLRAFGVIYAFIGVVVILHMVISWLATAGLLPLHGASLVTAYVVLYGAASVLWTRISVRGQKMQPARDVKSRVGVAALVGALLAHLVMLGAFVIVAVRQKNPVIMELAPLVLLASQGVLWLVLHAMWRRTWHLLQGLGFFAATLALAPLVGSEAFGLGLAAAMVPLMIVPGAYMIRAAGKPA
jgi:hypothetical protein